MIARAEAGVLNGDLAREAARNGLWYAPDPASRDFSTIGGNIATNAGGLCCVKYGVTRESVLGVTAVLADGELLDGRGRHAEAGRRPRPALPAGGLRGDARGGDRGHAAPSADARPCRSRGRRTSPPCVAAGEAVVAMAEARIAPALLELIDRTTMAAVEDWRRLDLDLESAALLLFQSDLPGAARQDEVARASACCERAGATLVVAAEDEVESGMLMEVRRLCFPALERRGGTLLEDVGVPLGRIPELLSRIEGIARDTGLTIATFGHAGDGNMHPTIVFDRSSADERARALDAAGAIFEAAIDLGGTITGEHGVGTLKLPWLEREIGTRARTLGAGYQAGLRPAGDPEPGQSALDRLEREGRGPEGRARPRPCGVVRRAASVTASCSPERGSPSARRPYRARSTRGPWRRRGSSAAPSPGARAGPVHRPLRYTARRP